MISNLKRVFFPAIAAILLAGALLSPLGLAPKGAAAAAGVIADDTFCVPTKSQPRLADLVVAGQTEDGMGVFVENIGCYATKIGFWVKVTLTDGDIFLSKYTWVPQFIEPGGSVIIPVDFDCTLSAARIEVDATNFVFEVNEHNNFGNAFSTVC